MWIILQAAGKEITHEIHDFRIKIAMMFLLDRCIVRCEKPSGSHDLQKIRAVFYLFPYCIDKIILSDTQSQSLLLKLLG